MGQQILERSDRVGIASRGERKNRTDPNVEIGLIQAGNQHLRDGVVRLVEFGNRSNGCLTAGDGFAHRRPFHQNRNGAFISQPAQGAQRSLANEVVGRAGFDRSRERFESIGSVNRRQRAERRSANAVGGIACGNLGERVGQ